MPYQTLNKPNQYMGKGFAISAIAGLFVAVVFGRMWFNIMGSGLPIRKDIIEIAGWAVTGLFFVAAVFVIRRVLHTPPRWTAKPPLSAWYVWLLILIFVEIAFIAIGNHLLEKNGFGNCRPAWMLFIVGAHFFPFAYIFRINGLYKLAIFMCAASVLSTLVCMLVGAAALWLVLPGLSGAASLWWFVGWVLSRMAKGKWIDRV